MYLFIRFKIICSVQLAHKVQLQRTWVRRKGLHGSARWYKCSITL